MTTRGVHEICDRYVTDYAALDPQAATFMGIAGHDSELTDCSPDGHAARAEVTRNALAEMAAAEPAGADEELAQAVFSERLERSLALDDAGLTESSLNVIDSPVQHLRETFDLMPAETEQDWAVIAERLERVPSALENIGASLRHAAGRGRVSPLRQVRRVAEQCRTWAGAADSGSFFAGLVAGAPDRPRTLHSRLELAAARAGAAYGAFAEFLDHTLAGKAPEKDAAGETDYRISSAYHLGQAVEMAEAYEWGWQEFLGIEAEMRRVAERIAPGAGVADAAASLDADERYLVTGQQALAARMQELSDAALAGLRGTSFAIPDELMRLDCKIAPPGGPVGAYYTSPTRDFSRPGAMWFSTPPHQVEFPTWREVTTVYHEGVPGHHLQLGTAVAQAGRLNLFQRLMAMSSGHAEGWALYAERLMRELGYLADDGELLGMLDSQLFRAARVIVDIGMHLELEIPSGTGFYTGERWTPELGLEFMLTRTITEPAYVRDEIDRYLGWPGQAPAYKLGERCWRAAREDARRRHGETFDLRAFHTAALRMGGMGLDTLKEELAML
jgi:uncharacterized protein (DUF885 family)